MNESTINAEIIILSLLTAGMIIWAWAEYKYYNVNAERERFRKLERELRESVEDLLK